MQTCSLPAGHVNVPKTTSSRVVYLTAYVTAAVITTSYAATFISFLAVRRYKLPFEDFEGILKDGSYRLGLNRATGHINSFQVYVQLRGRIHNCSAFNSQANYTG
jgi:hypothetical protein